MARSDRSPRVRMGAEGRREAILDAAAEAFAAQPYSEVKIADVSAAVGASEALVYKYFEGKEGLYLAVIQREIQDLDQCQNDALAQLPDGTPTQYKVQTLLGAYLDQVAANPQAWAIPRRQPGAEPTAAAKLRAEAARAQVDQLRALLVPSHTQRHEFALWGFWGFVEAACLHWISQGAHPNQREPLVETALGALQGALGDWAA